MHNIFNVLPKNHSKQISKKSIYLIHLQPMYIAIINYKLYFTN